MKQFTQTSSIPSSSSLPPTLTPDHTFYTSHNTIYNPSHLTALPSPILSYTISTYIFAHTQDRLYQLSQSGRIISKLKLHKKTAFIKCDTVFIYLFHTNYIEVFHVPDRYRRVMYRLRARVYVDAGVTCAAVKNGLVVVGNVNNGVVVYDLDGGREVIGSFIDKVVDVWMFDNIICVVCSETIYFYEIELINNTNKTSFENEDDNYKVSCKNGTINNTGNNQLNFNDINDEGTQNNTEIKNDEGKQNNAEIKSENCIKTDNELNSIKNVNNNIINEQINNRYIEDNHCTNINKNYSKKNNESSEDFENQIYKSKKIMKKIAIKNINCSFYANDSLFVAHENENKKFVITLIHNFEVVKVLDYEFDTIKSLSVCQTQIAVQTQNNIVIYNYIDNVVEKTYINDKILSFNMYKNFYFTATETSLQIYKDFKMLQEHKLSTASRILHIHANKSLMLTVSSLGTAKIYDIQNFYCFKTFDIPFNIQCIETNEDMSLIFVANTIIYVFDMKRGRCIDEIQGHTGPIFKMINNDQYIYSLGMDSKLRRQDVYDIKKAGIEIEENNNKTILDFHINKYVYILTQSEITVYDKKLLFNKSVSIKDTERNITYEKICVMSDALAFVYGHIKERHFIYIFSIEHGIKIQEIQTIKINEMKIENNNLVLKNEEEFMIYSQKNVSFSPVDLEIDCTEERVDYFMEDKNYFMALVCAVKLNVKEIIDYVLLNIETNEIENVVRSFPIKYINKLRESVSDNNLSHKWIKYIIFYHTKIGMGIDVSRKNKESFNFGKMNMYILESIKRLDEK
ncbi:U3 snoRNP protein [Conglomerata obtusa]